MDTIAVGPSMRYSLRWAVVFMSVACFVCAYFASTQDWSQYYSASYAFGTGVDKVLLDYGWRESWYGNRYTGYIDFVVVTHANEALPHGATVSIGNKNTVELPTGEHISWPTSCLIFEVQGSSVRAWKCPILLDEFEAFLKKIEGDVTASDIISRCGDSAPVEVRVGLLGSKVGSGGNHYNQPGINAAILAE